MQRKLSSFSALGPFRVESNGKFGFTSIGASVNSGRFEFPISPFDFRFRTNSSRTEEKRKFSTVDSLKRTSTPLFFLRFVQNEWLRWRAEKQNFVHRFEQFSDFSTTRKYFFQFFIEVKFYLNRWFLCLSIDWGWSQLHECNKQEIEIWRQENSSSKKKTNRVFVQFENDRRSFDLLLSSPHLPIFGWDRVELCSSKW